MRSGVKEDPNREEMETVYADDLKDAARRLEELSGIVAVPPYVVTFVAGFLGDRNGVPTVEVEEALRKMAPTLGRDASRRPWAERRAAEAMRRAAG